MIAVRYKKLKSGKYSIYLDVYAKDKNGKATRNYEFLDIYVTKDYSQLKNVLAIDREKIELVNGIKAKREIELINNQYSFKKKTSSLDLITYIEKTFDITDNNVSPILKHTKEYSNKPITFADIDYDWLEGFKNYLLSDKVQIKRNTIHNYLCGFRTILNKAVKSGIIQENPFKNVEIPSLIESDRTTLDIDEIKQLTQTQKRGKFFHQTREMFIFSCFTGLRLSDCKQLTWNDVEGDKLKIRMKKTQNLLYLPLTAQAQQILAVLDRNPDNPCVFWKIPAEKNINLHLRLWGYEAGLKKRLHFHIGRHSFATVGLTAGIDIYTMQQLLGHKTIQQTQIYGKIVDEKKKFEVSKFPTL